MSIATIIICIFISYYFIGGIITIIGSIFTTLKILKYKRREFKNTLKNNFVILLPVFHEQSIIEETLNYYNTNFKSNNLKIIIIASEREKGKITTYDLAKKYINKYDTTSLFTLIKAPAKFEGKVGQLNYALEFGNISKDKIIAVYDVDSRPSKNIIKIVDDLIEKNKNVNVFQQVSNYCNNLNKVTGLNSILSISDAFTQTKWALGFEYPLYAIYNNRVLTGKIRPLVYCIGHGLFVKNSFLNKIGGFPIINKNDDLSFGYLLSTLGEPLIPIPDLDVCNISFNFIETIKQYEFWSKGSNSFYKDIKFYEKKYNVNLSKMQRILFKLQGNLRNMLWAWRGFIWLLLMLISVLIDKKLTFFCLISLLIYTALPQIVVYIELKIISKIHLKNATLGIIFSPLNLLFRGIGPSISLLNKIFKINKKIDYKSSRK